MSKNRIIYATMTKHSKKIAGAIAEKLHLPMQNINERPVLSQTDTLFIVSGIYGGESKPELLEFARQIPKDMVKQVVLITSCTSEKEGQGSLRAVLQEKGIHVKEEFTCKGSFLFKEFGHPNQADIANAVDFAKKQI